MKKWCIALTAISYFFAYLGGSILIGGGHIFMFTVPWWVGVIGLGLFVVLGIVAHLLIMYCSEGSKSDKVLYVFTFVPWTIPFIILFCFLFVIAVIDAMFTVIFKHSLLTPAITFTKNVLGINGKKSASEEVVLSDGTQLTVLSQGNHDYELEKIYNEITNSALQSEHYISNLNDVQQKFAEIGYTGSPYYTRYQDASGNIYVSFDNKTYVRESELNDLKRALT